MLVANLNQMFEYILAGIQKENAGTLYPDDATILINRLMVDVVRERYLNGVDLDQKRIDDLRALRVGPQTLLNTTPGTPGGEVFNLPFTLLPAAGLGHGYMHMLNVGLRMVTGPFTSTTPWPCAAPSGLAMARPLREDERMVLELHPFKSPTPEEPYYYLDQDRLRVVAGVVAWASEASITYLRYPRAVSFTPVLVDPELPPHILQEICDRAIRTRLETIESPRYSTVRAEQQSTLT